MHNQWKIQDKKTKTWFVFNQWTCDHVSQHYKKDQPFPHGEGYDDEWPPTEDPCWECLSLPVAKIVAEGGMTTKKLRKWMEDQDLDFDMLEHSFWWLEMMSYLKVENRLCYLSEDGQEWLRSQ